MARGSSVALLVVEPVLVQQLELDEVLDLLLRPWGQTLVLAEKLGVVILHRRGDLLVEEVGDVHLEDREDLEEGLEADLVLPVLHATEVGLLDADASGIQQSDLCRME